MRLDLEHLPPDQRAACAGVLFGVAAADGVVDDEELLPLLGELALDELSPEERARIAGWIVRAPSPLEWLPALVVAPDAVRYGLVLRLVEVVGADAFIGPGEVGELMLAARGLGVTEDQVGAMRAFLLDLADVSERAHEPDVRARLLRRASGTLDAAGIPPHAIAWCPSARDLAGDPALAEGFGLDDLDDVLGDATERAARRAGAGRRLREGLDRLLEAFRDHERSRSDPRERSALELRRRALERRRRSLG